MDDLPSPPFNKEPSKLYGTVQQPPTAAVQASDESQDGVDDYKVYPQRFYVLALFSLFSMVQSMAWLTFGTIPNESLKYFGLTDDDVTLIAGTVLCMQLLQHVSARLCMFCMLCDFRGCMSASSG